ncbi:MAG: glycosyltransferase family 9 protein [Candidatus Theseobacter exili]|nr:glycosyltransferase family 9 protein [Candidatus Theseobacter exili]
MVTGSKNDAGVSKVVCDEKGFLNLTGKTDLKLLISILKRVKLFITNDSGPMHIAAAVGTPVLALFGPTDSVVYGPYGNKNRIVSASLECIPCREHHCLRGDHACMEKLDLSVVLDAALEMLGKY